MLQDEMKKEDNTLYNILKTGVSKKPTGKAFICGKKEYTYTELDGLVKKLADRMEELGIGANAKVLLCIEHPMQYVLAFFALSRLKAVIMPVYTKTGNKKIEEMMQAYDINFLVKSRELKELEFPYKYSNVDDVVPLQVYINCTKTDSSLEDVRLILFTSGTTSMPKTIMLSQNNILSNVQAISAYLKPGSEDSILLIKNLTHSSSIVGELLVGVYNGCTIVLNDKLPVTGNILKLMQQHKISIFFAVPTLLKGIMEYPRIDQYDLSNLKNINFYGAPMNEMEILRLIGLFPQSNLIYSYGQTEASPRVTYIEKEDLIRHPSSSGKAIEHVTVEIMSGSGKKASPMEVGEITVMGPNVMLGYYRNEQKTKMVLKNQRLYTGDMGYMDSQGFLYVTGRKDNMIISAGKNIYPEEIEGVLVSYRDILEAIVLEQKKDNGTSKLTAYVVLKEDAEFQPETIYQYCRAHLENYKIPQAVIPVKRLEKTPSGKIRRNQMNMGRMEDTGNV